MNINNKINNNFCFSQDELIEIGLQHPQLKKMKHWKNMQNISFQTLDSRQHKMWSMKEEKQFLHLITCKQFLGCKAKNMNPNSRH